MTTLVEFLKQRRWPKDTPGGKGGEFAPEDDGKFPAPRPLSLKDALRAYERGNPVGMAAARMIAEAINADRGKVERLQALIRGDETASSVAPTNGAGKKAAAKQLAEKVVDGFKMTYKPSDVDETAFGQGIVASDVPMRMLKSLAHFGLTAKLGSLRVDGDGSVVVSVDLIRPPSRAAGQLIRSFDRRTGTVKHDFFELEPAYQGKDIAKHILAASIPEYQRLGFQRVKVGAGLSVGGYAWLKYGFLPEPSSMAYLMGNLQRMIGNSRTRRAAFRLVDKSNPKTLWALADSTVGKAMLMGRGWDGVLDFSDKDQMERFAAYVGAAKLPPLPRRRGRRSPTGPVTKSTMVLAELLDNDTPLSAAQIAVYRSNAAAAGLTNEEINLLYPPLVTSAVTMKAVLLAKANKAGWFVAAMNAQLSALSGVPIKAPKSKGSKPAGTAQARWPAGSPDGKGGEWMGDGLAAAMRHVAHAGPKTSKPPQKTKPQARTEKIGDIVGIFHGVDLQLANLPVHGPAQGFIKDADGALYAAYGKVKVAEGFNAHTYASVPAGAYGLGKQTNTVAGQQTFELLQLQATGAVKVVGEWGYDAQTVTVHGKTTKTLFYGAENVLGQLNQNGTGFESFGTGEAFVTLGAVKPKALYVSMESYQTAAAAYVPSFQSPMRVSDFGKTPRIDFPHLAANAGLWRSAHEALSRSFWDKYKAKHLGTSDNLHGAILSYQRSSSPINDHLRGIKTRSFEHAPEHLAFGKAHAKTMVDFFQAQGDRLTMDLPFPIYRGVSQSLLDVIAKSKNKVWADGGFLSMAMRPSDSVSFAGGNSTLLRVKTPKGVRAVPAIRSGETELIVDHRYGFRVVGLGKIKRERYSGGQEFQVLDVELVDLSKTMKPVKKPRKKRVKKSDTSRFVSDEMISGTEEEMAAYIQECIARASGSPSAKAALASRANNLR